MTTTTLYGLLYQYEFSFAYPPDKPGLYALGKWVDYRGFVPDYIGKTNSLNRRLFVDQHVDDGHRKAKESGANLYATMLLAGGDDVLSFHERDLVRAINPPCNIQHTVPYGALFGGGLAALASGGIGSPHGSRTRGLLAELGGVLSGIEPPRQGLFAGLLTDR